MPPPKKNGEGSSPAARDLSNLGTYDEKKNDPKALRLSRSELEIFLEKVQNWGNQA